MSEGRETLIERAKLELEQELAERIKVAEFHEQVKTSLDIAKRLIQNGKLSPEEIADVTTMPIRFINEMIDEMNFADFCRKKIIEGKPEEIKRKVAEQVNREIALKMIERGKMTLEEIADICELPLEKVRELAAEKSDS